MTQQPDTYAATVERLGPKDWLPVWHNVRTGERHYMPYTSKTRKAALETAQAFADQAERNDAHALAAVAA
jgi:hypothetical protein